MKAMILAAGHGKRMLPLTEHTAKCLLKIGKKSLIEYHLEALARAGIKEIIINVAKWASQIQTALGDGSRYGVTIEYSYEGEEPLETGGGILHALPLIGDDPFLVISADIWTDFPFARLITAHQSPLHLIVVPNPPHHPRGDFQLIAGKLSSGEQSRYTYANIGIYHPDLFREWQKSSFPLVEIIRTAMNQQYAYGELYNGTWIDVGTPQRYDALQREMLHQQESE
ncbi:MAG: nucleotidyltransferase family protein [Legionellales bacterium]|nr:nucleotidyltransferase family protein [Legionellales bacterium]